MNFQLMNDYCYVAKIFLGVSTCYRALLRVILVNTYRLPLRCFSFCVLYSTLEVIPVDAVGSRSEGLNGA